MELFLFNSNYYIGSVKKGSSQDKGNLTIFFHFENNEIDREGLRVSRDNFAYKEYGMRLMLAPRSARAALLKLHGMRKLPGSPSFGGTLFRKGSDFFEESIEKSWGKDLANESGSKNGDYGTRSQSNNTVSSPHGFIIHEIIILKNIKEVTEVIDVKNWRVDNSRVLRWIATLFEWNSSVSSMKSSIQSTFRFRLSLGLKCGALGYLCGALWLSQGNFINADWKCGALGKMCGVLGD
ncbi:hypothetical protein Tco_0468087 [Tanacetum coccineum]